MYLKAKVVTHKWVCDEKNGLNKREREGGGGGGSGGGDTSSSVKAPKP
jgi:hypothetical protein